MMNDKIDTDLYSRQIGTFGMETMGKLMKMRILISGLRGTGVEIAKNIILAGPKSVTLHDSNSCEMRDLASNFYITEEDVRNSKSRADACVNRLAMLNDYVLVKSTNEMITTSFLSNFDVVVFTDTSYAKLIEYNDICRSRSPAIGFIAVGTFGLAGYIFVDFGNDFTIFDSTGEEPKSAIVASIQQGNPCVVNCLADKIISFQDGDYVVFSEILGMTELNDLPPTKISLTGKHSFSIPYDSTLFSPYYREGIITQAKVPHKISFKSFRESLLNPLAPGQNMLIVPDLGKFGRPEQLFFAINAVNSYMDSKNVFPNIRSFDAADECLKIANSLNKQAKDRNSGVIVDEIDSEVVRNVSFFSKCSISPMCAFLGGIAAQEIVKYTGKYTPISQWFLFDAFEVLPSIEPSDTTPIGSRYDDQIVIWGKSEQEKLTEKKVFLVGAGALGCEYLKSLSLMGFCCSPNGSLVVTDMDNIETSNLNRQFLFRREHVSKSKSLIAANAAKCINPSLNVFSKETRVGIETEDIFNDNFWEELSFVVNALDNVPSRMYINEKCLWYNKPLLESGTLGTKANSESYLPKLTQSYSDNHDPAEESIPLCTLKHFPHNIEHTIEWSRDAFQGLFCDIPQETLSFLSNVNDFLDKLKAESSTNTKKDRLEKVLDAMKWKSKAITFADCVKKSVELFHEYFYLQINQLLTNFPPDHINSDGTLFWSGPKRLPTPLTFDPNDPIHLGFIVASSNLYANILNIPEVKDNKIIYDLSSKVDLSNVKLLPNSNIKVRENDEEPSNEHCDENEINNIIYMLKEEAKNGSFLLEKLKPAEFEKDDDTNYHIAFIHASANLRARNYSILECDHHKCKMIAGRIIPAIATTTAMITGLVGLEALKISLKSNDLKITDFKNIFINLALPLFVLTEPLDAPKAKDSNFDPIIGGPVRYLPQGFTSWDKLVFNLPGCTLATFLDELQSKYGVEVNIVSVGNSCLYNCYIATHKQRLQMKMDKLFEQVTKSSAPEFRNYFVIEVSCIDLKDDVDVVLPSIKLIYR